MELQNMFLLALWAPVIVFNFVILLAIRNDIKNVVKKFITFEQELFQRLIK